MFSRFIFARLQKLPSTEAMLEKKIMIGNKKIYNYVV